MMRINGCSGRLIFVFLVVFPMLSSPTLVWSDVKATAVAPTPSDRPSAQGGLEAQTPVEMPKEESSEASPRPSSSEVFRRKGWRMLKPLQKVSAQACKANPISCLCPPETFKTVFHETGGWGKLARQYYMCQPSRCPEGQLLKRKQDPSSGVVKYACEGVSE